MNTYTRPMMVTIRCIAYNQEKYIRQCLEGFVMQKTNFRFEAIVHDDASKDGTADIVREFAEKYPDIIKPIYETENQYSKHDGSLERIMDEHTHGKYIAICEGDDYWIDPLKLQKQFDFMEAHPECSLCFHAHKDLYPNGIFKEIVPEEIKTFYDTPYIILIKNNIIGTNTIFCRGKYMKEGRPDFWEQCPVGDIPMRLFFSAKGKIGFINEFMSVYRRNAIGGWTSRKTTLKSRTVHHRAIIKTFRLYDVYTYGVYHAAVKKRIRRLYVSIIKDILKTFVRTILPRI